MEDYSLDFYYSNHRLINRKDDEEGFNPKDLERDLIQRFEVLLREFNVHTDLILKEARVYDGDKYLFSRFLKKTHFFNKSRVLVNTLAINGLNSKKFENLMIDYINSFYSDFLTMLRVWRSCKIAYVEEEM
jgi:hypothetical protein